MRKENKKKRTSTFILTRSEHLTNNTYKHTSHRDFSRSSFLQNPLKCYLFTLGMYTGERINYSSLSIVYC